MGCGASAAAPPPRPAAKPAPQGGAKPPAQGGAKPAQGAGGPGAGPAKPGAPGAAPAAAAAGGAPAVARTTTLAKDKTLADWVTALTEKKCSCKECGHGSCGCKSRGFPCSQSCTCKGEDDKCSNPLKIPKLPGLKYHVFLSAEKKDHPRVAHLQKCFANWGIDAYLSPESGKIAQDAAVRDSLVFVACMTQKYIDDVNSGDAHQPFHTEFAQARRRQPRAPGAQGQPCRRRIIPVLLEWGLDEVKDDPPWKRPPPAGAKDKTTLTQRALGDSRLVLDFSKDTDKALTATLKEIVKALKADCTAWTKGDAPYDPQGKDDEADHPEDRAAAAAEAEAAPAAPPPAPTPRKPRGGIIVGEEEPEPEPAPTPKGKAGAKGGASPAAKGDSKRGKKK